MPYIDYTLGTITLTQGSVSVIGTKTYWLQKIHANDILKVFITDNDTKKVITYFYIIDKVISDTQLLLKKPYEYENITTNDYAIQRLPEQFLNTELATAQLKILDKITTLDTAIEETQNCAINAEISANAARQYAAEAEISMNTAITQADIATEKADIATEQADIATEKAIIATEKADIATEKAIIATEKADIATEKVQHFINNGNKPGGAAIVDESGKILESLIPGSVKDVKSYPTVNDFPITGETGFLYLAIDTQKVYLWSGSPANIYVPVDTQLSLEGTGIAQTAARSDHHHNGIYEPAHTDFVWNGVIDTPINLDNTYIKDGNYIVLSTTEEISLITIQVEGIDFNILTLQVKTIHVTEENGQKSGWQIQTAYVYNEDNHYYMLNRIGLVYKLNNSMIWCVYGFYDWNFQPSSDTIRVNGSKYHFVTKGQYNTGITDGSIQHNDVTFIEETPDNVSFAVRSVNGIYPDGTGDVNISVGGGTKLANPTDYPLYRNANNIKTDGERVMITVALYGSVENFPIEANSYLVQCFVAETTIYQECSALKADGNIEKYARFGTTNIIGEWKLI